MVMVVCFHHLGVLMKSVVLMIMVVMLKRIVLIIKMRATVKMCVGTSRASTASAIISIQPSKVATLKHKEMLSNKNRLACFSAHVMASINAIFVLGSVWSKDHIEVKSGPGSHF